MSKRKTSDLIKDILKCIEHITNYTGGISFQSFTTNFMIVEACLYNIQVIGEAVSQLPDDLREEEKQIPWALIKGMMLNQ